MTETNMPLIELLQKHDAGDFFARGDRGRAPDTDGA
jgi:hypothetical protein